MRYVIDGYNMVYQVGAFKGGELRSQREGLLKMLESAQARDSRLKSVTVVFDGPGNVCAPQAQSTVRVVFSQGRCADLKIREMLESSTCARDITVVSDDRQVRSYARSLGAKRLAVRDFIKMITPSFKNKDSFKLDNRQSREITQELESLWLKGQ